MGEKKKAYKEILKDGHHFEDLGIDGSVTLKLSLSLRMKRCRLNSFGSE
jgi:hypothetical protein